jgi:uncharacterized protein affecting Mg2+/Co2+ transport
MARENITMCILYIYIYIWIQINTIITNMTSYLKKKQYTYNVKCRIWQITDAELLRCNIDGKNVGQQPNLSLHSLPYN